MTAEQMLMAFFAILWRLAKMFAALMAQEFGFGNGKEAQNDHVKK